MARASGPTGQTPPIRETKPHARGVLALLGSGSGPSQPAALRSSGRLDLSIGRPVLALPGTLVQRRGSLGRLRGAADLAITGIGLASAGRLGTPAGRAGLSLPPTIPVVARPGIWHHNTVIVRGPGWIRKLWTGPVPIAVGTDAYEPAGGPDGTLMGVDPPESAIGPQGRRARASIFVGRQSLRDIHRYSLIDLGPREIEIGWIISRDKGQSWQAVGEAFAGRLSAGVVDLSTGEWSFDLESWHGDADRVRTRRWSDSEQRARTAMDVSGADRGFEYRSQLAAGLDVEWRL